MVCPSIIQTLFQPWGNLRCNHSLCQTKILPCWKKRHYKFSWQEQQINKNESKRFEKHNKLGGSFSVTIMTHLVQSLMSALSLEMFPLTNFFDLKSRKQLTHADTPISILFTETSFFLTHCFGAVQDKYSSAWDGLTFYEMSLPILKTVWSEHTQNLGRLNVSR